MSDYHSQTSQPMRIQAGLCPHGDGHVYLHAGYVCLSFSYDEFLHLAQVVRDTARDLQEQVLAQGRQTEADAQQGLRSLPLFHPGDPATPLAGVLCLLQTETDPMRIEELRRGAAVLDEATDTLVMKVQVKNVADSAIILNRVVIGMAAFVPGGEQEQAKAGPREVSEHVGAPANQDVHIHIAGFAPLRGRGQERQRSLLHALFGLGGLLREGLPQGFLRQFMF